MQNSVPASYKSTDLHCGFQQCQAKWQPLGLPMLFTAPPSYYQCYTTVPGCQKTQGKTLSSTVIPRVDLWHLLPPTFPNNWNCALRLTHTTVFDLNNSIFSFKGWILIEECHLQQGNHDSCTAHNCHEKPQPPMREGLLRSKHGENAQVEIMQARNKAKRLWTVRKECYSRRMYK